ncbi:MAG: cadherin domain-containing protein, partial [Microcystis sp. M040S2]
MLTKIINIEARWMRSVTDFLPAGDYKVEYIGVAQGGQYNAWNYRYNYYPWWSNQYQIDSSEFSFSTGRLSENWGSDTLALANAKNTTFVLKNAGNVTFWIYDTVYDDNTGGISLRVTSIPTPATNITLSNSNIAENQAVNTVIGDFTSTDPDPGDTFTYSLVAGAGDTDNSFFTITGSQLRTKAVFDFETKKTYSIRVKTTDQDGQFYEKQLTVNVTNIIEPGTFSFSDNNYVVKEDGTVVKAITINRTNNFEGAVSVTVTPTDGTAKSINDYNNTPIVVNFAAGETSKTVTVPLINDTAYELEENLNLAITNVTGGAIIGTQNTATLTILNDDAAIRGVLAFSAPTYSITENGTPITQVVVNRTGGSDTEVSATITVNNGTATADDYNNTPIKVTFAHGDSAPKIITIPIKEDSQFEAVETLNLSLINPTNGVTIGSQNTAIVKIIDNDNFVFTNTDIQPTKLEQLTLPIPTALKQYETLSSELDKAKVKLDTTEEQLTLANDDYSFAKETFAGSLSKQKSLTETLQNLGNKKTALTSSFTQSKTQNEQKQKDIQKNIDDASTRLKAETNAGLKDGIQKEINGYLIQIQEQQNLLSIATTKYDQDLGVIDFQISESNQDLQVLTSNIIPKQVEELEKKNQALVAVKTAWEANKQAVTVADKALGDFLTDYAFLKTQDYSSKFLQDTVNSLNQKISNLQTNLTSLKNSNGSNSEISALEKAILEKQKIVGEVQDYQKTVLAGEVEFKQELETRKTTSADHLASVKVALGNNDIESYVTLSSQLANQLKGLTTVWVDDLQDNHNLTIKVWNGLQAESQAFDSLTSYIDENLATPYGDYYLNEIQLDEALQIQESTVRRRDALADSVNFVTDALFLAKKQLQEYQDLAKLSQHYSDLTKYEKEFNQLNFLEAKLAIVSQFQQKLVETTAKLISVKEDNKNKLALAGQKGAIIRPQTGNKYFWTNSTSWEDAQAQGEAAGGNLVTINDGDEQNWAIQIRPRNVGYFWLGLTDKFQEGRWQWISGEPITYTYWRPGEPNNDGDQDYGYVWIGNEWDDGRNGSLPGLIEINLQSLAQKETTITQEIEQAKASFNSAVTDLLKFLDSPSLHNTELLKASIIQKQALNDSYLTQAKWYSDQAAIYWDKSQKQGATNDLNWVTWDDYTKKSQALQQQSADFLKSISDDIQAFIGKSELVLQPKLINAVSDEVTNKTQDLVVQIDLTNDQQEQWIERNLQKYIEQKQNSIVKAQEAPLTAIRETFQQPTRALFFDGVNDYIQINLNEAETEVTHELWFKTTSLNGGLFSVIAGSGGHDRSIHLSNGNIVVRIWNNEVIASSGLNLADGKWHHVAHVFGASVGGQQIYVDGQLVASGSRTISDFNWQDKISIGYSADSGYFKGEIDEVRVWNVAKTQAQIQTYYNRNLTGKEQGLAGYWNFDETSGNTVNDLSSNNNNATLINGIQRTVANSNSITRPEGKALYFDGVNDYINMGVKPSFKVSTNLTLEAWINPQQDSRTRLIVGREGEYLLAISGLDNTIHYAIANSNPGWNWISTGYGVKSNQWSHIAFSFENGRIKTYVNGSLIYTYDGVGTIGDVSSQDELRIGNRQWNNTDFFKGQIDEVRVWNVTKTQAEIQANLNQKLTGNEQGLAGYWNFEEATGNTVNDLTANKNNGTLINGVQPTLANANPITRPEGKALYFDGVNDYINAGVKPSLELSKTFTIEAWINPQKQIQQYGGIIVNREGEYQVIIGADGTLVWAFANSSPGWTGISTGYVVKTNEWTHIAISYDNGLIKTYANGLLVHTYDGAGSLGDAHPNEDEFRIGYRQAGFSQYFKGEIDEVRVWNITRTQAEIQANLNQKLTGNEQGLVGYWNFEETTGNTVNDLTTNKNNGLLINGVQRTVTNSNSITRPEGKALFFDGVNDYINVGVKPSLKVNNNLTIEAWINPQQDSRTRIIVGREGEYLLAISGADNTLFYAIANSNPGWNWISTGYGVKSNQWSHIAFSFDNGRIKTYVNGQLIYTYDGMGTIGDVVANQDDLRIGNRQVNGIEFFKGEIDEVRVWNVTRTQAEIQANLNQKLSGNEQGLVGYWNFEESAGNTVNDLTANKNNGTLINGVQRTVTNSNPIAKPEGKALFFDGVNDYIQVNLNEPETEVTHELWFKTTSLNGGLFSVIAGSGGHDRSIHLSNGNIVVRIWNNEVIASSGLNLADGKWHHVAHVFGASVGGQQIYVDGQLVATGSKTQSDFGSQDKIVVGYSADSGYFKGEIDEVRVWNVAKTQSQIQANLSQKLTGNEQGLIGYWNLKENSGNTVYDLTANKNNGTLINGVQRTIDSSIAVPQIVDGQTNLIESKTIANLQTLRLETAYLTLQAQQNPDKVQNYLTEYQVIQDGNLSILPNVSFNFINQAQGLKTGYWANENNSEQLIGDFNGDGKDDIVNLQSDGISNNWIALSNGNGTFNLKGAYITTGSNNSQETGLIAGFWSNENNSEQLIGDFNGDGKDDIVNLQSDGI